MGWRVARDDITGPLRTSSPRLVGRAGLLRTVEQSLAAGLGVLLTGPNGIGKSSVLDAITVPPVRAKRPCCASAGSRPNDGSRAPQSVTWSTRCPPVCSRSCRPPTGLHWVGLHRVATSRATPRRADAPGALCCAPGPRGPLCCCWSTTPSGSTPPRPTSSASPSGGSQAAGSASSWPDAGRVSRRRSPCFRPRRRDWMYRPSPPTSWPRCSTCTACRRAPRARSTSTRPATPSSRSPWRGRSSTTAPRAIGQNRCPPAFLG